MSTLLEKEIKVNRIVTTSTDDARAIEDPARAKIVEILYRQTMSADQISTALKKHGFKKAYFQNLSCQFSIIPLNFANMKTMIRVESQLIVNIQAKTELNR